MNILADFHHADLWWAIQLLANRLGATIFRPYGMDWYDQGYYKLYGDLRRKDPYRYLAKQYLVDTIYRYFNGTGVGRETKAGCLDYPQFNLLTLEEAKSTQIDIVLCSVNENEPFFYKLKEFFPVAKFVRHAGNDLDTNVNSEMYQNLLSSALAPYNAFNGHKIIWREEFDLTLFKFRPITNFNNIYTFQGDLGGNEDAWELWTKLKHSLEDFNFKAYGVGNEDGKIYPKRQFVEGMLNASFVFQSKGPWEGYGHVIHNAVCLGRPPIVYKKDYADKLVGCLLKDELTCLFIDSDFEKMIDKIRYWSHPKNLWFLSQNACGVFKKEVNFDTEFVEVKKFFEELV